jgi:hypothetical protein
MWKILSIIQEIGLYSQQLAKCVQLGLAHLCLKHKKQVPIYHSKTSLVKKAHMQDTDSCMLEEPQK